jgi:HK97 family phage prohead protease
MQNLLTKNASPGVTTKKVTLKLDLKKLDDTEDKDYWHFEAYASIYGNKDLHGDIVLKGAYDKSLLERKPKLLFQHNWDEPVGPIDSWESTDAGLLIRGRLPKADTFVSGRLVPQLKSGSIDGMSVGIIVTDHESTKEAWLIKEAELWEISFVTLQANPQATLQALKTAAQTGLLPIAPKDAIWDEKAALNRLAQEEGFEQKAFLVPEGEGTTADILFADVIDGKMVAIPQAIEAAAVQLLCSKSIGADSAAAAVALLEKYYDQMDKDSPFKCVKSALDMMDSLKGIERILRDNFEMSASQAKNLTHAYKRVIKSETPEGASSNKSQREAEAEEQNILKALRDMKKSLNDALTSKET